MFEAKLEPSCDNFFLIKRRICHGVGNAVPRRSGDWVGGGRKPTAKMDGMGSTAS